MQQHLAAVPSLPPSLPLCPLVHPARHVSTPAAAGRRGFGRLVGSRRLRGNIAARAASAAGMNCVNIRSDEMCTRAAAAVAADSPEPYYCSSPAARPPVLALVPTYSAIDVHVCNR